MSIEVQNITKLYGKQKALDNVSFTIKTGDVAGFLGPNGAGKSTMMKILSGFIPQTSGTATVNEYDVINNSFKVRQNIGYLPEHNPLYLDMYVKEYLRFTAELYKIPNISQRIEEMIEQTGLQVEQKKKIGALSKGYRQRVGLANALIHNPPVLILDEPTTGLDPNQIIEIRNLISHIGQEKTVMLSTHIMQEVEAICDHVLIIKNGKIVANDATTNLQYGNKIGQKQVIEVEFNKSMPPESLNKIEGVIQSKHLRENQWLLESVDGVDIRQHIFQFAVDNQIAVLSMQQKEKTLEEVFRELTV